MFLLAFFDVGLLPDSRAGAGGGQRSDWGHHARARTRHFASRLGPSRPGGYTARATAHSHAHLQECRTHTQQLAGGGGDKPGG